MYKKLRYRLEVVYMEFSKSDWKLFRAYIGDWQETYMERLVKEIYELDWDNETTVEAC